MSLCIEVDGKVALNKIPTREDGDLTNEKAAKQVEKLQERLYELQELMYGAATHSCLIVLQGRDTSGKEGTITALSRGINAHGVQVSPFKAPTPKELSHDFLWRIHACTPPKGLVGIFNRSHYEDVLIVRVHSFVPEEVWRKRYEHIRAFEKLLVDSNTIVLKFFLHISKEEQEERLRAREEEPQKAWKLNVNDWKQREHLDAYAKAYEEALAETSVPDARWQIVPADQKWYRNLVVLEEVVAALEPYREVWLKQLEKVGKKALAEVVAYREAAKIPS